MIVLALWLMTLVPTPGAQLLGHGNRAVGLLVRGGGGAAGGWWPGRGVEGVDVGGSVDENLVPGNGVPPGLSGQASR